MAAVILREQAIKFTFVADSNCGIRVGRLLYIKNKSFSAKSTTRFTGTSYLGLTMLLVSDVKTSE